MSARDYSVSFGYGAFDGVYYTASRPHRGNDRPTPTGTAVTIGDTIIGQTGASGLVSGPHIHTQAGWDMWCQNTTDPTPFEFQPGTVVQVGTASQWGNYIIIETPQAFVCYAHLSTIYVSIGDVISGAATQVTTGGISVDTIKSMYWRLLGREADQGGIDTYTAAAQSKGVEFVYNDLKNSTEGQADWERRNPDRVTTLEGQAALVTQLTQQLADARTALANEQAKPPKEVIKTVTQIIEKHIEVPTYVIDTTTRDNASYTRKRLDSLFGMVAQFRGYVKSKLGK